VTTGEAADLLVREGGAEVVRRWQFPSRASCVQCHHSAAGYALGFNTRQLNQPAAAQSPLQALAAAGHLDSALPQSGLDVLPRLTDASVALETRARAWLESNCAACHQPGGSGPSGLDLRRSAASSTLIGRAVANNLGDPLMRVLTADYPERSALAVRMATRGSHAMPPVDSTQVDPMGATVVTEWLHRLAQAADTPEALAVNMSTRGIVEPGESVMIGGFVIAGSSPRQLLLRGVGPELGTWDVAGRMADPQIELFRGSTSLGANDNWGESADPAALAAAAATAGAFPLAQGSRDAALLVTLQPGLYSVHVRGLAGSSGVGLFEAYTLGGGTGSRLINLSTRLRLGVGERVAIPGLVVDGDTRRTFLIRAVGPGLESFGIEDTLADPRLTLMRGSSPVASNDDWGSDDAAALALFARSLGAFALPAGSRDAALRVTLEPGAYTIVTSGATSAEGVVLVEIYEAL
jgi:mono/diheme cytochrome c family protein